MSDLAPSDFPTFFQEVNGYEPFPWQTRLARRVLETGEWPEVIDLPTGSGKTATLDIALFSLAVDPGHWPRRIVYVIDRRIIVDQVIRRAHLIRTRLASPGGRISEAIRERLSKLSGGAEALGIAALRGGIPKDGSWAERPDQPWVLVSTVDQFGSRLLFRGYGIGARMRPIHAGLAGNDCLVILDEVHLSTAFATTLRGVHQRSSTPLPRRWQVVEMSATPTRRAGPEEATFRLKDEDLDSSQELSRRMRARKRATLTKAGKAKEGAAEALPPVVNSMVSELPTQSSTVGVVVNRVRTARCVAQCLADAGHNVELLTGRMRPIDRAALLERIEDLLDPDRSANPDGRVIVVATQAIEVGADVSFDAMITECAPIDSLRQRFGRLDRRGRMSEAQGVPAIARIIGIRAELSAKDDDAIYGPALKATWEELERRFRDCTFDVGPLAKDLADMPEIAFAPRAKAPLLLASHLDAWVQTKPEPSVQPSPAPFLHGLGSREVADVTIVWRKDRSPDSLLLCPPRAAEGLDIPIWAARAWLATGEELDVSDVDTGAVSPPQPKGTAVVWRGPQELTEEVALADLRPGDIVLVEPERGGLRMGTWDPSATEKVSDLGDQAQWMFGRMVTLRLDSDLLPPGAPAPPGPATELSEFDDTTNVATWLDEVQTWMEASPGVPLWFSDTVGRLRGRPQITIVPAGYLVLHQPGGRDSQLFDGSDEANQFTGTGVTLRDHMESVGRRVHGYASRLGLPEQLAADLELAGRWHDIGKLDPRFQLMLVGGDEVRQARLNEPLAKSLPGTRRLRTPYQWHDILGVALLASHKEVISLASDPDLVLHLIGTHHGFGRPLHTPRVDPTPCIVAVDGTSLNTSTALGETSISLEMADRFWRLVNRYGHYGLAWLEALLRLADHRESEDGRV